MFNGGLRDSVYAIRWLQKNLGTARLGAARTGVKWKEELGWGSEKLTVCPTPFAEEAERHQGIAQKRKLKSNPLN